MARYIDADALLEVLKSRRLIFEESTPIDEAIAEQVSVFEEAIEEAPTADVAEVIHAYWKTVTEIKDNTVCGDGRQIQYKICSNCEQPMGVCGNDYCGHCGARMDGPEIFTPEYMQSLFQEARERLERIKNSPGDCWGLSFKQLDYELMDDRFKSNSKKKCTEGEE